MAAKLDISSPGKLKVCGEQTNLNKAWEQYLKRFEYYIKAMNITKDEQKRALLLHVSGSDVQDIFETLADQETTYADAVTNLSAYFKPKQNIAFEWHVFHKSTQSSDETVDNFIVRLSKLSISCEFQDKDDMIKDKVNSCTSTKLRNKLLEEENLTLEKVKTISRTFELSETHSKRMAVRTKGTLRESFSDTSTQQTGVRFSFPLESSQWSLNLRQGTSFQDTMAVVGHIPEDYQVNLAGWTAVFCDMEFYPSPEKIDTLALDSVSVAIGATVMAEDEEIKSIRTFSHPNVVALGEIVLDYTTHLDWPRQERQFLKLLSLANARNVVVVLHLRGISTDPLARVVTLCGLALCAETLRKRQTIHLHCFYGHSDVVREWLKEFPNTYLGFTGMARNFNHQQCEGLRAVPRDRLLLESDAPYFPTPKFYVNAPCLLGYTAELVADVRREKYDDIISISDDGQCTKNIRRHCWRPMMWWIDNNWGLCWSHDVSCMMDIISVWSYVGSIFFTGN